MVLAGALSDALDEEKVFKRGATHESNWTRLRNFLQARVEFDALGGKLGPVDIKASLRTDPDVPPTFCTSAPPVTSRSSSRTCAST